MVSTGLLVLTNPKRIGKLLPAIKQHVLKTLYIQYFPEKTILIPNSYSEQPSNIKGPYYSQIVSNIYEITSSISNCLDVRVLLSRLKNPEETAINTKRPVELVIFDTTYAPKDANTFMQDYLCNVSMGCKFITLDDKESESLDALNDDTKLKEDQLEEKVYKNVVLGGTFDRMHNGHKIFVSQAILRCSETLTMGVTDVNMIQKKLLWELIEPLQKRISYLKDFASDVDSNLKNQILPIEDMFGPTNTDPTFQMIVVSEETKKGADKINEVRSQKGLSKLDIYVVPILREDVDVNIGDSKMSSSNRRKKLLGARLKEPNLDGKPLMPYVIGLTGNVASGKSSVAEKLQTLGAALIDCDKVAHYLYQSPDMKCYKDIIISFGDKILTKEGLIDRKILGSIVFSDEKQLEILNNLLWPAILDETKKRIIEFHEKGFSIVVVEAAILVKAGWQSICHDVWSCIIPKEEAITRLMKRNLSEEEAKKRINLQLSNKEQVNAANFVFCSLWSYDFTHQQIERAWKEVISYVNKHSKKC